MRKDPIEITGPFHPEQVGGWSHHDGMVEDELGRRVYDHNQVFKLELFGDHYVILCPSCFEISRSKFLRAFKKPVRKRLRAANNE